MKTGIIMEINDRSLTVLTPEGEFLRARKQNGNYEIGQEIDFFPTGNPETKKVSFFHTLKGKTIFAAAFALLFAVITIIPFYQSNEVYAYMSIDINPSIELGVNEEFQVIEIKSYNKEGKEIIQEITDWKNKDINIVTKAIILEIKKQGYTEKNNQILIATVNTRKGEEEYNELLEKELTEIKETVQKEKLDLIVLEGTEKEREEAMEKGLSTGLYKENKIKTKDKSSKENKQSPVSIPSEHHKEESHKKESADTAPAQHRKTYAPEKEKKKEIRKNQDKKHAHPSQAKKQDKKHTPPGQAKKQDKRPIPPGQAKKQDKKPIPPGQAKKQDRKHIPPGQAKKQDRKHIPPGQAKKQDRKHIPPGQAKKQDRKHIPPGQAKKYNKEKLQDQKRKNKDQ